MSVRLQRKRSGPRGGGEKAAVDGSGQGVNPLNVAAEVAEQGPIPCVVDRQ
jgi:hypothetical protein